MQIPKIFYGKTALVKRECKKLATKVRRGGSIEEVYGSLELVDSNDYSKEVLIVLTGPSPLVGGESHFHVYIWLWMLWENYCKKKEKLSEELKEEAFGFCTNHAWALLAIMTSVNCNWFNEGKYDEMWQGIFGFFNTYDSVGRRFSKGANNGFKFWETATMTLPVMIHLGVPKEEFTPTGNKRYLGYLELPDFWHLVEKYNLPTGKEPNDKK